MVIIRTIEKAKFLEKKEHKNKNKKKKIREEQGTAITRIMKVAEKLNLFHIYEIGTKTPASPKRRLILEDFHLVHLTSLLWSTFV
jgi:hypothetical protein